MSRDAADLWTRLANDIRAVDGNHDLGAGELAHRLVKRGWTLVPAASETDPTDLLREDDEFASALIQEALRIGEERGRLAAASETSHTRDGAPIHPDDGYAYDGCNGPACRDRRAEAEKPSLDALYERVAAMLCQHVADAEAHETTSEAIDDWHGVTARTIVSIVRATPPDPPT